MAEEIQALELQVSDNAQQASTGLENLARTLSTIRSAVSRGLGLDRTVGELERIKNAVKSAVTGDDVDRINRLASALERLKDAGNIGAVLQSSTAQVRELSGAMDELAQRFDQNPTRGLGNVDLGNMAEGQVEIESAVRHVDSLTDAVSDATQELTSGATAAQQIQESMDDVAASAGQASSEIESTTRHVESVTDAVADVAGAAQNADSTVKSMTRSLRLVNIQAMEGSSVFAKLGKSIGRIAFYRGIRTIVKEITEGLKFGLRNLREYSKAVGTAFNPAVTSLENAVFKMKDSIAAALQPVLLAIIPVLESITRGFIRVIELANQFLSLLTGHATWTKATDAAASTLDKVKKKGAGAHQEIKDLLADWDELNIIQQETSKGGSGSTSGYEDINYGLLFTEESRFDKKIRELVDWLKEHFDQLKQIVLEIGAALAAWKISALLGGLLGQLLGLAATGLVIKIVWDMVTMFDKEYLKTGDVGWLIGDILTTAVGATIAGKMIDKVLGTGMGVYAVSLTLAVSAIASIVALLGDTDVSALSKEALTLSLLSALKMGFGAGYLLYKTKYLSGAKSVAAGTGVALVTFGVVTGIEAVLQAERDESIDYGEYLKSTALSSLSLGLGSGFLLKTLGGMSIIQAAGGGAGVFVATASVLIGVAGVLQAVKDNRYTPESIGQMALSSVGVGAGASIVAAALGALSGTVAAAGVIATGLTLAALIGVSAYLLAKQDDIQWGNVSLTQEQIQTYAASQDFFKVDVSATLNLVNTKVTALETERKAVEEQVAGLLPSLNVVKLGLAKDETLSNIQSQLYGADGNGGLMADIGTLATDESNVVPFALSLVPITDEAGKDLSGQLISDSWSGWSGITEYANKLGAEISKEIKHGLETDMKDFDSKLVSTLTEKLINVTRVMAQSKAKAQALVDLDFKIEDLDENSFTQVVDQFDEYRNQLRESYRAAYKEAAISFKTQADTYRQMALDASDPTEAAGYEAVAAKAEANFQLMLDEMDAEIERAVDRDTHEGAARIVNVMKERYAEGLEGLKDYDFVEAVVPNLGENRDLLGDYLNLYWGESLDDAVAGMKAEISNLLQEANIPETILNSIGVSGWNILPDTLQAKIRSALTEAYGSEKAKQIIDELSGQFAEEIREGVENAVNESAQAQYEVDDVSVTSHAALNTVIDETFTEGTDTGKSVEERMSEIEAVIAAELPPTSVPDVTRTVAALNGLKVDSEDVMRHVNEVVGANAIVMEAIDSSPYIRSLFQMENATEQSVANMASMLNLLGNTQIGQSTYTYGNGSGRLNRNVNVRMYADGGFPKVGELFMANEDGSSELVGSIGRRSAVANSDQIVEGISSGVADGQSPLVALMAQMVEAQRQLLNKKVVAEVRPSSGMGRTNVQSNHAYSKITG